MKTSKRDVSRNSTLFPILFTSTDDEDGNPFAVTSPCSLAARSSTSKAPSCTLDNETGEVIGYPNRAQDPPVPAPTPPPPPPPRQPLHQQQSHENNSGR